MALRLFSLNQLNKLIIRTFTSVPSGANPTTQVPTTVPGLSGKVVRKTNTPVGPGAATDAEYKVPEYFLFNKTSYYEAEIEMSKFRCPQPDATKK